MFKKPTKVRKKKKRSENRTHRKIADISPHIATFTLKIETDMF